MKAAEIHESSNSLSDFMKSTLVEKFRPIAYYDEHMDCIRVQLQDCSFTEQRLSKYWTILRENHGNNAFVGFNIKGVRHLCVELDISTDGVIKLTRLIDAIVKAYPDSSAQKIQKLFTPVLREEDLQFSIA